MTYELAKELKDAGFPQQPGRQFDYTDKDGMKGNLDAEEAYYVPTLEELIEACGDGYFSLVHTIDHWAAHMGLEEGIPWHTGLTPDEAVARLWLALNT